MIDNHSCLLHAFMASWPSYVLCCGLFPDKDQAIGGMCLGEAL